MTRTEHPGIQLVGSLRLTFRELWATKVTIGLFVVTTIGWSLLAFAMNLDLVEGTVAGLRIFGLQTAPTESFRDPATGEWARRALSLDSFVIGMQSFVFGASYLLGTLLGLFATAPLATGMMEAGRADLLLSKPIGRIRFLAGHVLAVCLTVLALATYLVVAVWLTLSVKTGVWVHGFLWAIPLITAMFAVMYSVVLLASVTTQSTGFALVAAYGLVFFSAILVAHEQIVKVLSATGAAIFMAFYHILPNFMEVIGLMSQLSQHKPVESWYPFFSSIAFGAVVYTLAGAWFSRRDF